MQVLLDENIVDVIVDYKNNKNLYARINEDLKIYVTCNKYFSEKKILDFIEKNKKSFVRMYNRQVKLKEENNYYYYLGNKCVIVYDESINKPIFDDNMIIVKDKKMLDKFYKDETRRIFQARLDYMATMYNNIPKYSLRIRNMKTRWGVCNRANNVITLNSELIKKDITLLDYVCVHELSHFIHADHSKNFWYEVSLRYPDYKEARKRLRG